MADKVNQPLRIAVLISGTGRTLKNVLEMIDLGELNVSVEVVIASTPAARGLQYAEKSTIPIRVIERSAYATRDEFSAVLFDHCRELGVDLVVMAGFIKLLDIPDDFLNRVINIHPSLIPAFCGKGFYGHHVHEAALEYGVKLSGCTVHFVDNQYDHGPVILQMSVPVLNDDTPDSLNDRVFEAEKIAYPEAIQLIAEKRVQVVGRRVKILPPAEPDVRPEAGDAMDPDTW